MKAKAYIILFTAVISLTAMLTACGDSKKQSEGESTTGAVTATTTQNAKADNAEQTSVDGVVSNTTDQATKSNGETYSDVAKEATKPEQPAGQIGLNTTQEQLLTFAACRK